MFDIAFSEIMIIAVVALIVIGPERLPKTARTLGHLFGRLQRYVSDVKADISREMELDELRKLQQQVHSAARDLETSVHSAVSQVETNVRGVEGELNAAATGTPATAAPSTPTDPSATPDTGAAPVPVEPPRQPTLPGLERP